MIANVINSNTSEGTVVKSRHLTPTRLSKLDLQLTLPEDIKFQNILTCIITVSDSMETIAPKLADSKQHGILFAYGGQDSWNSDHTNLLMLGSIYEYTNWFSFDITNVAMLAKLSTGNVIIEGGMGYWLTTSYSVQLTYTI